MMKNIIASTIPILPFLFFASAAMALSSPMADPSSARSIAPQTDFKGGAGVGRLVFDSDGTPIDKWSCKYDMVLVERIQGRPDTDNGLFVPRENLPKLHLCRGEYNVMCAMCYFCVLLGQSFTTFTINPINLSNLHGTGTGGRKRDDCTDARY